MLKAKNSVQKQNAVEVLTKITENRKHTTGKRRDETKKVKRTVKEAKMLPISTECLQFFSFTSKICHCCYGFALNVWQSRWILPGSSHEKKLHKPSKPPTGFSPRPPTQEHEIIDLTLLPEERAMFFSDQWVGYKGSGLLHGMMLESLNN